MSKNIILQVENVSKQYRLGQVGTGTLSHDLNRWFAKIRGKEDPFLKVGETNDRTSKGSSDYVWALKDINFEIEQGQALGIIGRNGAGKSTLLKLLSRVTKPTTGTIKYKGRIASLLEVGTGFHPEMTGRENIYLNGAILGMTRKEISRKFDEIVAFAGVERYVDTPVKRYSSGMYVRLAFAVAAHLESEILIVDEVLAVGDAEFQKKCLGKMNDVTKGEGRTVLFVSHNMASIQNLCNYGIFMEYGTVKYSGDIQKTIDYYLKGNSIKERVTEIKKVYKSNYKTQFSYIETFNEEGKSTNTFKMGEEITLKIKVDILEPINSIDVNVRLNDVYGNGLAAWRTQELGEKIITNGQKEKTIELTIKDLNLFDGLYNLSFSLRGEGAGEIDFHEGLIDIEIIPEKTGNFAIYTSRNNTLIYTPSTWKF